jgi:RNA polymerase primary sigma factor
MRNTQFINTEEIHTYLKEIKKIPLVTHDRLTELVKLLKKDGITDKERDLIHKELVIGNLRFVISIAKLYQGQGVDLADLISEGNIGLIRAAKEFNPDKEVKFISYAVWWVRQSILQSLNENSRTIRLPSNIIQNSQKERKIMFNPDDSEMVEKYSRKKISSLPYCVDLNGEIGDDGSQLIDIIPNHDAFDPESFLNTVDERKIHIKNALSILTEKERTIVEKYFGLCCSEMSLEDLGVEFNCTKERIRQLKETAMKKLRNDSFQLLNYL